MILMFKKNLLISFFASFFCCLNSLFSPSLLAQEKISSQTHTYKINKDHSEILFSIPYMISSSVSGRFQKFQGSLKTKSLVQDASHPLESVEEFRIKIDSSSIFTGNNLRDSHLKRKDFLNIYQYPDIVFNLKSLKKIQNHKYEVKGELSIKGLTQKIIFNVKSTPVLKDTWNRNSFFIHFKFKINRHDFNITWNKTLDRNEYLLGDTITVKGTFQFQPFDKATPSALHMIPDNPEMRKRERILRGEISASPPFHPQPDSKLEFRSDSELESESEVQKNTALQQNLSKKKVSQKRTFIWWGAFFTIGALGFTGVVMLGYSFKKMILQSLKGQYDENTFLGHLSDIPLISLVFMYSIAMWLVGWH